MQDPPDSHDPHDVPEEPPFQPAGYLPPEEAIDTATGLPPVSGSAPTPALTPAQQQALGSTRALAARLREAGFDHDDALAMARGRRERFHSAMRPPETALAEAVAAVFKADPRRLVGQPALEIPNRPLRFLWKPRLPCGIALLSGDTGAAKSLTAAFLVARHTTGAPFPLEPENLRRRPGIALVMVDGEESATSFREKVVAAHGDAKRLHIIDVAERIHRAPEFPTDAERLAEYMKRIGANFCVADGLFSFLEDDVDIMNNASLRKAMVRVNYVMRNSDLCLLGLRWVAKSASGGNALGAGMGATSGTGTVRSEMYVGSPDKSSRRVLSPVKTSNEALGATPSLEFEIRATRKGVPYLHFSGKSILDADNLFVASRNKKERTANTRREREAVVNEAIMEALRAQPDGLAVYPSSLRPTDLSVVGLLIEHEIVSADSKDPCSTQAYRKLGDALLKDKVIVKEQRVTGALTPKGKPERAWFWKLQVVDERDKEGDV